MTRRQRVVNPGDRSPGEETDAALAAFVADVLELAGLFRRAADDIARSAGQTQTLWYALSVFSADPLTVAQAARRLGTSRQAVQRSTNELVARGLAETRPNPDHRASPLIVLTETGQQTLAQISQAASLARRDWFADEDAAGLATGHAEVRRLRDVLRESERRTTTP